MLNFFRNGEEELGRGRARLFAIYFCWFEAIMFSLEKRVAKPVVFL